jgi:hypothetical protein
MSEGVSEKRIAALEAALLDYIGRYGLTDLARRAFIQPENGEQGKALDYSAAPSGENASKRATPEA